MWSSSSHIATGTPPPQAGVREPPSPPKKRSKRLSTSPRNRATGSSKVEPNQFLRTIGSIADLLPRVHGQPLKGSHRMIGRRGSARLLVPCRVGGRSPRHLSLKSNPVPNPFLFLKSSLRNELCKMSRD